MESVPIRQQLLNCKDSQGQKCILNPFLGRFLRLEMLYKDLSTRNETNDRAHRGCFLFLIEKHQNELKSVKSEVILASVLQNFYDIHPMYLITDSSRRYLGASLNMLSRRIVAQLH